MEFMRPPGFHRPERGSLCPTRFQGSVKVLAVTLKQLSLPCVALRRVARRQYDRKHLSFGPGFVLSVRLAKPTYRWSR